MSKTNELIQRFLGEPARNLMHAMYDDYVEANVKFRSRSGMKTFIIRRQLSKCCDWCADLAGIYESAKAPDDVYRRHDNCKCMVTFRNEKGKYTDAWSKKEFQSQKDARKKREQELLSERTAKDSSKSLIDELRRESGLKEELNKLKRRAINNNEQYIETHSLRTKYKAQSKGVGKANRATAINGTSYQYDGKKVVFNDNPLNKKLFKSWTDEWKTAETISNTYGGRINMNPRVLEPKHVRVADYNWEGILCDRKAPTGAGTNTIKKNVYSAKGQAEIVALDLTKCPIDLADVEDSVKALFSNKDYKFLKGVILIKNNKILKFYERV